MFMLKSTHRNEVLKFHTTINELRKQVSDLEKHLEKHQDELSATPVKVAFDFTQVVNVFSIEHSANGESILSWPSAQPGEHTEWRLPTSPEQHEALIAAWKLLTPKGTVV